MKRPLSRGMSRVGTILFFSVFLVAGLVATWFLLIRPVLRVCEARQWPLTPCTVVSSEVRSHSDSDGTTYSVHIVYRYTVNGREHQSDRYDFMSGSSSGYKGKQEVVNRYPPGKQAVCYFNPSDPSDAVICRDFTPLMLLGLFPLIFVGVGAGGMVWAFTSQSFRAPIEGVPPWQARPDWAEGRIVHSNKPVVLVLWVVAIILNIAAWPAALMLMDQHRWVWLLPLVGLLLIAMAIQQTRRWQKFGESIFELATRPGAIGGALAGTLRLRQFVRFDGGLKLCLRCIRVDTSGDSATEHMVWMDEQAVTIDSADSVPVNFYVPPDCVETDTVNRILWRLEAKGRVEGADYSAQFEVPVFKVAQDAVTAARALAAKQTAVASYERPAESPIRVEPSWRGGTEFHFPAARNPGAATGLTLFFLIWTGGIVGMIYCKAPVFLPIMFTLFDLPVLLIMLNLWFGASHIVVDRDAVTVTKTVLGWKRTRTIAVADIAEFTTTIGMTSGTTVHRNLKLLQHAGKSVTLASSIKDHREAEWLAAEMARVAGIASTNS